MIRAQATRQEEEKLFIFLGKHADKRHLLHIAGRLDSFYLFSFRETLFNHPGARHFDLKQQHFD